MVIVSDCVRFRVGVRLRVMGRVGVGTHLESGLCTYQG